MRKYTILITGASGIVSGGFDGFLVPISWF